MSLRIIVRISLMVATSALVLQRLRSVFQFVVVNGESMCPTLRHGDLVVGRRDARSVSRGVIVVFTVRPDDYEDRSPAPPNRRVKRIVATAGDRAPATLPERLRSLHNGFVPAGHIALAGDAPVSEGSAEFGYINVGRVESVVVKRLRRGRAKPPLPPRNVPQLETAKPIKG